MPSPQVSKSFLSLLFQVLSVLLSLVGDVLGGLFHPLPAHGCITAEPLSGSTLVGTPVPRPSFGT